MYTLYKEPISLHTLDIIHYLFSVGIDARPNIIYERNHPDWCTELPCIQDNLESYIGLSNCIKFYSNLSGIANLEEKSKQFKKTNPNYKIKNQNTKIKY